MACTELLATFSETCKVTLVEATWLFSIISEVSKVTLVEVTGLLVIFPEACKLTLFAATGLLVRDTGAFTVKLAVTKELLVTIVEGRVVELFVVLATKRQRSTIKSEADPVGEGPKENPVNNLSIVT